MCRQLTAGFYFLLALFLFTAGGCWWEGGGTIHVPRDTIRCDQPWVVTVIYTNDPKDWRVNMEKEAGNFAVHYRVYSSDEFATVPMAIEKLEPKLGRAYLEADMPAIPCDSVDEYVEYYYDHVTTYNRSYNRSKVYRAVVGY